MEKKNHKIDSEEDFTRVSSSFEGNWRDGIGKKELEKLIIDFLDDLYDYIENQINRKFMGHIKGILRTDSGRIKFNLVSKQCGAGIRTNLDNKIHEAEADIVIIFYDPDLKISEDKIREKMKNLWKTYPID